VKNKPKNIQEILEKSILDECQLNLSVTPDALLRSRATLLNWHTQDLRKAIVANEKISYDLTTSEGIKNVSISAAKHYAIYALAGPIGLLAKFAYDAGSKLLKPTENVVSAQAKAAVDIIKAGAENNVSEIDITMSQEAGAHFGADFEGHPIKFTLGKSGTVKMTVKYKNAP
jgi:hypothetical protein